MESNDLVNIDNTIDRIVEDNLSGKDIWNKKMNIVATSPIEQQPSSGVKLLVLVFDNS